MPSANTNLHAKSYAYVAQICNVAFILYRPTYLLYLNFLGIKKSISNYGRRFCLPVTKNWEDGVRAARCHHRTTTSLEERRPPLTAWGSESARARSHYRILILDVQCSWLRNGRRRRARPMNERMNASAPLFLLVRPSAKCTGALLFLRASEVPPTDGGTEATTGIIIAPAAAALLVLRCE